MAAEKEKGEEIWTGLGLQPWLARQCVRMGLDAPTEVQRKCIPEVLAGRDVVACSPTGTGKTAAYAVPLLQQLAADMYGVFAVVVTPSRELAFQIGEVLRALGRPIRVQVQVIVGGHEKTEQALEVSRRPHILIGTPGRLAHHFEHTEGLHLRRISVLVLDEADRLLGEQYVDHMKQVLQALPPSKRRMADGVGAHHSVRCRRTLLFSATMSPALRELHSREASAESYQYIADGAGGVSESLTQRYVFLPETSKVAYLLHLLREASESARSVLVFVATKRSAELLTAALQILELPRVSALHSGMLQQERQQHLARFRGGQAKVLVSTDLASRGLDIPTVDLVVNVDLPARADDYVHRVGRTARAGRAGLAISFVTERDVARFQEIERVLNTSLEEYPMPDEQVLLHFPEVAKALQLAEATLEEEGKISTRSEDSTHNRTHPSSKKRKRS